MNGNKPIFDPFGWAERFVSPNLIYQTIRWVSALVFAILFALRITAFHSYAHKALWLAEASLFALFTLAYVTRSRPVERSSGWKEIFVPVAASPMPFALLFSPPSHLVVSSQTAAGILVSLMCIATFFSVWGLWYLRGSFSITTEARKLVTGGPYRWIRHPMYLGEIATSMVVAVFRLSPYSLAVFGLFAALQLYRSRIEEHKLTTCFGKAYAETGGRAWWFLPYRG